MNRRVEGIVEMLLNATQRYAEPLTAERLFGWHTALFPARVGASRRITVGAWRKPETAPMQVASGYIGHEKVHFEAPAAACLETELRRFLEWFNTPFKIDPVVKAGIAHLWFVTLHPFEDGNGRMARAIADCALARADNCPQRFYSMSPQIELERKAYYAILESTQKGNLDLTPWLHWFLGCLGQAIESANKTLANVFRKADVWKQANQHPITDLQRSVINRLLDGFEGRLPSSRYAQLAKCSSDTALRDIRELMGYGLLQQGKSGGRSTSYALMENSTDRDPPK